MMQATTDSEQDQVACRHHWVIEMAQGPTSKGRCRRCNQVREFFNDPEQAAATQAAA